MPSLRWTESFAALSPLARLILRVMMIGIVLSVCGLGAVTVMGARELVRGTPLASALLVHLTVFWSFRAGAQSVYNRRGLWPRDRRGRLTHLALMLLFAGQALDFLLLAIHALGSGR